MAPSPVHPRWHAGLIGLALALAGCGTQPGPAPPAPFGLHAEMDAATADLYRWVTENRDKLAYIPCTCGCRDVGHTSNASCFVRDVAADGTVTYDPHGQYCGVCKAIAKDTRRKLAKGIDLSEIRRFIDRKYQGRPTDTPYPPTSPPQRLPEPQPMP